MTCDSLIFDMDGTLWDAVDTYALIWNETFRVLGIPREPVTRYELIGLMGQHLEVITAKLYPELSDVSSFLSTLEKIEKEIMPRYGGKLYPGVKETIPLLAGHHKLFMVSNCGPDGLEFFMDYTGLRPFFTDTLTHGGTGLCKADNIKALIESFNLTNPFYVGDTVTDSKAAEQAGAGMVWAEYGFGNDVKFDYSIKTFADITGLPVISPLCKHQQL